MLKSLSLLLFFYTQVHAMDFYPLKFGMGAESCHPNSEGLTECRGFSPNTQQLRIQLTEAADGGAFYGYHTQSGTFEKIGFRASVTVVHFDGHGMDDMLKIKLQTWSLENPNLKTEMTSEVFTDKPENLNRMNIIATPIGTDEDYSTVILGLDKT